jgi:hypothetical protein
MIQNSRTNHQLYIQLKDSTHPILKCFLPLILIRLNALKRRVSLPIGPMVTCSGRRRLRMIESFSLKLPLKRTVLPSQISYACFKSDISDIVALLRSLCMEKRGASLIKFRDASENIRSLLLRYLETEYRTRKCSQYKERKKKRQKLDIHLLS